MLFFLHLILPLGLVLAFWRCLGSRLGSDFLGVVANLGIRLDDAYMVKSGCRASPLMAPYTSVELGSVKDGPELLLVGSSLCLIWIVWF